jgi:hypothetical protein
VTGKRHKLFADFSTKSLPLPPRDNDRRGSRSSFTSAVRPHRYGPYLSVW